MPGRVDLLVVDRVVAGGGLQAGLADRDRVGLDELQVLPEAKLEGGAIDR